MRWIIWLNHHRQRMTTTMKRILIQWMRRRGVFDWTPKAPIRRSGSKVKEIKVGTVGTTTERAIMFEMETTTVTTTSTGVTMVIDTIEVVPMFRLKIRKLLLGMVEVVWHELKICYKRWWGCLLLVMSTPSSWDKIWLMLGKRWMHILFESIILGCKWPNYLLRWTYVNWVLFLAIPFKIQKMMDIAWRLLLEGVGKPLIHLYSLY